MSIGKLARAVLGSRFESVGERYRSFFTDLNATGDAIAAQIPPQALLLDVGGGDGQVINYVLDRRTDIRVAMTDIAPAVGDALAAKHRDRVQVFPNTPVAQYTGAAPDAILVCDVLHHIPRSARDSFMLEVLDLAKRSGTKTIIIKDLHPGSLRGFLGFAADWVISGDRNVTPFSVEDFGNFCRLASTAAPFKIAATDLSERDYPNYCVALHWL